MKSKPHITRIEVISFEYELKDFGPGTSILPNPRYRPGQTHRAQGHAIRIQTDAGITGEYVGGAPPNMGVFPG